MAESDRRQPDPDDEESALIERALEAQLADERRVSELSRSFLAVDESHFDEAIHQALATAARLAGADRAKLVAESWDADRGSLYRWLWEDQGIPKRPDEWRVENLDVRSFAWISRQLFAGQVVHLPDVEQLPQAAAAERQGLLAQQVRSFLAIPIMANGRLIACFDFHCVRRRRVWTDHEILRLRLVGDVLSSVFRRRHAEDAQRRSEARFRAMAEHVRDTLCEVSEEGRVRYCSPSVYELVGYRPEELLNVSFVELLYPADADRVAAALRELFAGQVVSPVVFRVVHRDGRPRVIEANGSAYHDAAGARVAVTVIRDVSERERETAELQQRVKLESLVASLSRDFFSMDGEDFQEAIRAALASLAAAFDADRCAFVSMQGGARDAEASWEWRKDPSASSPGSPARRPLEGHAWTRARLERGEVVHVPRADALPAEAHPEAESMEGLGCRSQLAVPAHSKGALVGVLALDREREERPWSSQEITFLRMAAELFSGALRRTRSEVALRESEERYRALAENSKDCICEVAEDGRYLYVSPSYADLLGYERRELEGRDSADFVHPEDRARLVHGSVAPTVHRAPHRQGGWLYLEGTRRAFRAPSGEQRLVAVLRDVTERERSKETLYRQLELEGRVADLSRFFLDLEIDEIEVGLRSKLADVADLACAEHSWLYFMPPGQSPRLELYEWWNDEIQVRPEFHRRLTPDRYGWTWRRFQNGSPIHVPDPAALPEEAEQERVDFQRRGVRSLLALPLLSGGVFIGILGFETLTREHSWSGENVTLLRLVGEIFVSALRRRLTELELRASQQQLLQAQKMEAVGTLAGGIAHDFNNHLAVMLGNARFVQRQAPHDEELSDALTDLERSAEHCAQLTRSLLAFSRRTPVAIQSVEPGRLVSEVRELVGPLVPSSIRFEVDIEEGVEPVAADPTQLQQVLVNLVVNARDAMPAGGVLRLAAIRRSVGPDEAAGLDLPGPGDYVELRVQDDGIGMGSAVRERVFEPFFTTKALGQGTGLGLAVAYGIVKQSGGAIAVESEPGVGTLFSVLLPVSRQTEAASPGGSAKGSGGGCERVLLVEDEPAVRRLIQRMLEGAGYRVWVAEDGVAALDRLGRDSEVVDALVSDLVMPRMGGLELAEHLLGQRPGLRIVFLSGNCDGHLEGGASRLPGARFLQKPFAEEALLSALRSLLDAPKPDAGR